MLANDFLDFFFRLGRRKKLRQLDRWRVRKEPGRRELIGPGTRYEWKKFPIVRDNRRHARVSASIEGRGALESTYTRGNKWYPGSMARRRWPVITSCYRANRDELDRDQKPPTQAQSRGRGRRLWIGRWLVTQLNLRSTRTRSDVTRGVQGGYKLLADRLSYRRLPIVD